MSDSSSNQGVHLRDYLRIIARRKWTVILFTALLIGMTVAYLLLVEPNYTSKTVVILEPSPISPLTLPVEIVYSEGRDLVSRKIFVQTQFAIIKSRTMAKRILDRLDLWDEFTPDFTLFGSKDPVENFVDLVYVDQPNLISKEVEIGFSLKDPQQAKEILDVLLEEYRITSQSWRDEVYKSNLEWLTVEGDRLKAEMTQATIAVQEFKEAEDLLSLDEITNPLAQKLQVVYLGLTEAELATLQVKLRYEQTQAADSVPATEMPELLTANPIIVQLKAQYALLDSEHARLQTRYGEKHPRMIEITNQMSELRAQISQEVATAIQTLKGEYMMAREKERSLKRTYEELKKDVMALNKKRIDHFLLAEEAKAKSFLYEAFVTKLQETDILSTMRSTLTVRTIDPPEVPIEPAGYRKYYVPLAIAIGLVVGILLAFFKEYFAQGGEEG